MRTHARAEGSSEGSSARPPSGRTDDGVSTAAEASTGVTSSSSYVVGDHERPGVGQMRRSAFLTELRLTICEATDAGLVGTPFTSEQCPYIEVIFSRHAGSSPGRILQLLARYAPETAGLRSSREVLARVAERTTRTARTWATTGQVPRPAEELPTQLFNEPELGDTSSISTRPQLKASGPPKRPGGPQALQRELRHGHPIDPSVRLRMERAFGADFGHVRLHTDARAGRMTEEMGAWAATVGGDIAFARGAYRPGTGPGDALLAHELAHVQQQRRGTDRGTTMPSDRTLEAEADRVAVAVTGLLSGVTNQAAPVAVHGRSGLRLSRCDDCRSDSDEASETETEPPVGSRTDPTTMTEAQVTTEVAEIDRWLLANPDRHSEFGPVIERLKQLEVDIYRRQPDRRATVRDMWVEMEGMPFDMRRADGGVPEGTRVSVLYWSREQFRCVVTYQAEGETRAATVSKAALSSGIGATAGITRYSTGIGGSQAAYDTTEVQLAQRRKQREEWMEQRDSYRTNPDFWQRQLDEHDREIERLDQLNRGVPGNARQPGREANIDQALVRETLYNRFDEMIVRWVAHYNRERDPDEPLHPNVVKSIFFQETRFGTQGQHIELPPYGGSRRHEIRSYRNLGQAIDSWWHQQYIMMKEMAPELWRRHGLDTLDNRRLRAHPEGEDKYWYDMTQAEMLAWNGGAFGQALQEFKTHRGADGRNYLGTEEPNLLLSYEYMIRSAIRWLFFKYEQLPEDERSWSEAVRAYNGSGQAARDYSDAVMGRARGNPAEQEVGNQ